MLRAATAAALAAGLLAAPAGPAQRTWSTDAAQVPAARAAGLDGRDVLVAVLDGWVDRAHPDLGGRVRPGADCLTGTCRPGQAPDACDHGTHVAGTLASSTFGVAPAAEVLPVRVLGADPRDGSCTGRPRDVVAGIRWAVAQGAQVLNLSLGTDVDDGGRQVAAAVEQARRAGVLVVASAGNDDPGAPASTYGGAAVVVAATGPDGRLASYSRRGPGVTLAAPGGDAGSGPCTPDACVTSLFPGGGYAVAAGTSMAAPLVSGVAALLLAQDPARTPDDLVRLLTGSARPLAGAGAGVLDAAAAVGVRAVPLRPALPAGPARSPARWCCSPARGCSAPLVGRGPAGSRGA